MKRRKSMPTSPCRQLCIGHGVQSIQRKRHSYASAFLHVRRSFAFFIISILNYPYSELLRSSVKIVNFAKLLVEYYMRCNFSENYHNAQFHDIHENHKYCQMFVPHLGHISLHTHRILGQYLISLQRY